jgi:hypothetical protein
MTDDSEMVLIEAMFAAQRHEAKQAKRRRLRQTGAGLLVVLGVVAAGFGIDYGLRAAQERSDRQDAAYEKEIAGVEDRFNREYAEEIQLEVYKFASGKSSSPRTIVAIDGTIRPDCILWRTSKTADWTLQCDATPQPTLTVN